MRFLIKMWRFHLTIQTDSEQLTEKNRQSPRAFDSTPAAIQWEDNICIILPTGKGNNDGGASGQRQ
jgi:hypothetical protein